MTKGLPEQMRFIASVKKGHLKKPNFFSSTGRPGSSWQIAGGYLRPKSWIDL